MSHLMTKPTKWHVHPAKTQISLCIHPVWSESSLSAWRKLESFASDWADREDSDQSRWMPRLIWVFMLGAQSFCWFCHEAAQIPTLSVSLCESHQPLLIGQEAWTLIFKAKLLIEPRHEKNCFWGLRPDETQTDLLSYRDKLESWNFLYRN